jgi:5,10-methylenetetrahydromethanopterin reductase
MKISLFDSTNNIDDAVSSAGRANDAGHHRYWAPQIMNADPISILSVVGREIPRIKLGTSVVAMQTTLPQTLAQQALTVNNISGGRFTLGLGTNHEPVMENVYGIPWRKPYTHMVEYLDALIPLLNDRAVSTSGEFVTARTGINVKAAPAGVMLAALGPKMLRLAADRTAGTITWMTGPATIEQHVRPTIGADAEVAAGVGIQITDDIDGARAQANIDLAIYGQLPSYRAMLDREGVANPGDMVLIGDADTVRQGLLRYKAAGATEAALSILGDKEAAWAAIAPLGGEI